MLRRAGSAFHAIGHLPAPPPSLLAALARDSQPRCCRVPPRCNRAQPVDAMEEAQLIGAARLEQAPAGDIAAEWQPAPAGS
jgi:hypothetical protein